MSIIDVAGYLVEAGYAPDVAIKVAGYMAEVGYAPDITIEVAQYLVEVGYVPLGIIDVAGYMAEIGWANYIRAYYVHLGAVTTDLLASYVAEGIIPGGLYENAVAHVGD